VGGSGSTKGEALWKRKSTEKGERRGRGVVEERVFMQSDKRKPQKKGVAEEIQGGSSDKASVKDKDQ